MYLFLLLAGGIVAALTGRVFDRIAGFRQIAASVREWSQSTGRSPWIGYSAGACFAVGWLLLGVAIVGMYLSRFQQKPAPALFSIREIDGDHHRKRSTPLDDANKAQPPVAGKQPSPEDIYYEKNEKSCTSCCSVVASMDGSPQGIGAGMRLRNVLAAN